MKKVAINGFGRIGRVFFRQAIDREDFEVVAVNDLANTEELAYLLKYDSVYGRLNREVEVRGENLVVGGREVAVLHKNSPADLPWGEMGIDLVVEATGVFNKYGKAKAHLDAGAGRVVITAPAKDEEGTEGGKTVLMGVNNQELGETKLTCNGSCTTNATSPVVAMLANTLGIRKAILNTIHGYTSSQGIVDRVDGKDFRRGRAAAVNIVLSSTGAATTVTKAIPSLANKFDGVATRVPVIVGSVADIVMVTEKKTSVEEVNEILRMASQNPLWEGIVKITDEPIVSTDIIGEPYGAIVDTSFTRVVDGDLVSVKSWYDNEWGYTATLARHVAEALKH